MAENAYPHPFNLAELGKTLKEVSTDIVHTTHQDVISRWFHSSKDADLYIWSDMDRNIIKQQLTFYGQVVEWNVVEGLKTGHIIIDERHESIKGSDLLHFDAFPQSANVCQALDLLEHVSDLKREELATLVRNFSSSLSEIIPKEELTARFGDVFNLSQKPVTRASIFNRLVTRLGRWFKS